MATWDSGDLKTNSRFNYQLSDNGNDDTNNVAYYPSLPPPVYRRPLRVSMNWTEPPSQKFVLVVSMPLL